MKLRDFFSTDMFSWIVFCLIFISGIIVRILTISYTSSDIFVWKEAADMYLNGKNPYLQTLESFQIEGSTHFYAYFPLWLYICSIILAIFPESWFFFTIKRLILLFDIQVMLLFYIILRKKVSNNWRLKLPIIIWFITPIVIMTGAIHGKFDSLLISFILLACIFHEKKKDFPEAIFLSLAILTKTIALIIVPLFFLKDIREKNKEKILSKIVIIFYLILLFSVPFLNNPVTYLQGVLGVHVTRGHDLAPLLGILLLLRPIYR